MASLLDITNLAIISHTGIHGVIYHLLSVCHSASLIILPYVHACCAASIQSIVLSTSIYGCVCLQTQKKINELFEQIRNVFPLFHFPATYQMKMTTFSYQTRGVVWISVKASLFPLCPNYWTKPHHFNISFKIGPLMSANFNFLHSLLQFLQTTPGSALYWALSIMTTTKKTQPQIHAHTSTA